MTYIFNNSNEVYEPFYQTKIKPYPWEFELLQTKTLRRLKFLSHYGTGSLYTSAKHTRFEHTIGVWTIISTFFPEEEELRIAALLHDIGHLPFSHAVERTLGFNHHHLTEEYIKGEEVSTILHKFGFDPNKIIALLNMDSPLTHKTSFLGADHLDSFLRDSYMLGKSSMHPAEILEKISFNSHYVEADLETSRHIMDAIYHDHKSFLNPITLAMDALLAKAISIYASGKEGELKAIQALTNNELLQLLLDSNNKEIHEMLNVIMWYPEKVVVHDGEFDSSTIVEVKKVYDKTPLVNGTPLTSICSEAREMMDEIRALKRKHYFSYTS